MTDDSPVPSYSDRLRLDGRTFVVLGAGQGMGRQAAHALAQVGAHVLCADIDGDRAARVAKEVSGASWAGDATTRTDIEALFDEADRLGPLRGIVDIVGMAAYASVLDIDDDTWNAQLDVNLRHAFLALQVGGPRIAAAGGGSMTFVASVVGIWGAPMMAAYGVAKAGLMSLVRTAAVELGPSGIRVNAVAPGAVWTPRVSALVGEQGKGRTEENAPLRRVAEPADIAGALLFLASDLSGYVTGHTIVCDGGVAGKLQYPMPDVD